MQREHLVMFYYCDIAAQVRGKGFAISQLAKRLRTARVRKFRRRPPRFRQHVA